MYIFIKCLTKANRNGIGQYGVCEVAWSNVVMMHNLGDGYVTSF